MDKIKVDAVITDLEIQLETSNNPLGSYIHFKFIDTFPHFTKVNNMIEEIKKRSPIWKKEHYKNDESEWLKGNPIKK